MMLAHLTKVEELELDEKEAKRLAECVARVNALYDGFILSEKQLAWINLGVAGCAVYGPRVMAYKLRMAAEAKGKPVFNCFRRLCERQGMLCGALV
jgi:hypothetical protein